MKPKDAVLVATATGADTFSALRLSVVAATFVSSTTCPRGLTLLTRPAIDLPASWAPALPVHQASFLPSPGAAARAGYAFVLLRGSTRRHIPACSGGSGPAFKTCLQLKRAGASVSAHAFGGLTNKDRS